jgi:thiazole synthase
MSTQAAAQHRRLLHRRRRDSHRALAREAAETDLVKLEVIGDRRPSSPTPKRSKAAKVLVKEGFFVLPYTNDDPIVAASSSTQGAPR